MKRNENRGKFINFAEMGVCNMDHWFRGMDVPACRLKILDFLGFVQFQIFTSLLCEKSLFKFANIMVYHWSTDGLSCSMKCPNSLELIFIYGSRWEVEDLHF